ncbi:hypothetical protein GON26_06615 [Flavobacterium sp. GA093]|uniref:Uncharacterized protein n=1 Tax=Flavobacterium hydrocarbonoxydans TaxID=2683249 RepID=A0A6I4NI91_9FLAO|nr:hypothetical protein [Flavobacterium hydrocarbonoxydans]MWB94028.1 hypothetical protein [Flavobacterium hydrocarbonoxydans]
MDGKYKNNPFKKKYKTSAFLGFISKNIKTACKRKFFSTFFNIAGGRGKCNNLYYYYHCENSCKHRTNSETANSIFIYSLKDFMLLEPVVKLYSKVILEIYNGHKSAAGLEKTQIVGQISSYEKSLSKARELLATRQIDADDYQKMKNLCKVK